MGKPREAGRLADKAFVKDRRIAGPAVTASSNVLINRRQAARVDDRGIISGTAWKAIQGAPHVLINNKLAHRKGDLVQYGDTTGRLKDGSANVLIGDTTRDHERKHWIRIKVIDIDGVAITKTQVRITTEEHESYNGITDSEGFVQFWSLNPCIARIEVFKR